MRASPRSSTPTAHVRRQQPLTSWLILLVSLARSLDMNALCGLYYVDVDDHQLSGTYTAEGIVAISEMLKVNTTLQSIRCVARVRFLKGVSSPCHLIALSRAASLVPSLPAFSTSPFCSPVPPF